MSDETRRFEPVGGENPPQENWKQFDWQEGVHSWEPGLTEDPILQPVSPTPPAAAQPAPAPTPAPKKKRRKGPKSNAEALLRALIYVAGVLAASFVLATGIWMCAGDLLALNKPEKTVSFTISADDTFGSVASRMKSEGLIQYKSLFELFAAFTHKTDRVTAGTYQLNTEMDYSALLNNISSRSTTRETTTVTIPEGYTAAEAFQLLEDAGVCAKEDLLEAAKTGSFDFDFLKDVSRKDETRLEGYLFPDTYEFYKGAEPESVLRKMLSNFNVKFDETMAERAKELGYTRDQIIIMASIIEKETTGSDRERISSVIHNRLTNTSHDGIGGKLEMDSTVQYVLSERKENLTDADLSIDSPYNTRLYAGLPVGPICNPGEASLMAALYPERTDYYYFMLGDDGTDHFFNNGSSFVAFKLAQKGNRNND